MTYSLDRDAEALAFYSRNVYRLAIEGDENDPECFEVWRIMQAARQHAHQRIALFGHEALGMHWSGAALEGQRQMAKEG